jgi:hypothetical protein
MTNRAAFTEEEWKTVLEGPPSAGMIVVTAGRGGTIRETFAIGKAYVEARKEHGESELLDEIVTAKPQIDHTRYHSYEELKQHGLELIRSAVAALQGEGHARGGRRVPPLRGDARGHRGKCPPRGRGDDQRAREGSDRGHHHRPRR